MKLREMIEYHRSRPETHEQATFSDLIALHNHLRAEDYEPADYEGAYVSGPFTKAAFCPEGWLLFWEGELLAIVAETGWISTLLGLGGKRRRPKPYKLMTSVLVSEKAHAFVGYMDSLMYGPSNYPSDLTEDVLNTEIQSDDGYIYAYDGTWTEPDEDQSEEDVEKPQPWSETFGEPSEFALKIELCEEPEPKSLPLTSASWGRLEIWVNGLCLTRSVRSIDVHSPRGHQVGYTDLVENHVEWYLDEFLRWSVRLLLLREDPYPTLKDGRSPVVDPHTKTGAEWITQGDVWDVPGQTRADEEAWFDARFNWKVNHELSRAFPGADVPYVVIRRVGSQYEFSWDNENWKPSRKNLRFTEVKGSAKVGADFVTQVWTEALSKTLRAIERRSGLFKSENFESEDTDR